MSNFPWLTVTGAIPLAGSLAIALIPGGPGGRPPGEAETPAPEGAAAGQAAVQKARDLLAKRLALVFSLATFALSVVIAVRFVPGGPRFQFTEQYQWIPQFGVHYALGVDGIALVLLVMTTLLMPLVVLASWNDAESGRRSVKTYFALMMVLETMLIGVFAATDVFLFYVFFEAMLVPMYFMIGSYGTGQRQYAAVKFLLYSLLGGLLMLVAVIALYVYSAHGTRGGTFLFTQLTHLVLSPGAEKWLFLGFFIAFAIKAPLWPFHTWLPDAAAAAQPGAAVLMLGVMDKVGTFGMLRYCLELFPSASHYFTPLVITLSVIGVIYGAVVAIGQADLKRLLGYVSLSHFGLITLGVFAMTTQGETGATFYMVNHGLSTGALFLIAGFLISRRGSQRIADYGGVQKVAPLLAGLFLVAGLSALALPGMNTFVSEFLVLVGTFSRYKVPAVLAATGTILSAIYILWMYQRTMHGPVSERVRRMPDLRARELWAVVPLAALIIATGVYPKPVLDVINPAVRQTLAQLHSSDPAPAVQQANGAQPAGAALQSRRAGTVQAGTVQAGTAPPGPPARHASTVLTGAPPGAPAVVSAAVPSAEKGANP